MLQSENPSLMQKLAKYMFTYLELELNNVHLIAPNVGCDTVKCMVSYGSI